MVIKGIGSTRRVFINEKELKPHRSQQIVNHSPDGFNWGYAGSGSAQLALAILLEIFDPAVGDPLPNYQMFKQDYIVPLKTGDDFLLIVNPHKLFKPYY